MKVRRFLTRPVTVLATVIMIIAAGALAAPANASTGWDLTRSDGDLAGTWAYGSYWWSGTRLYVTVHVKDTAANGENASVKLSAWYANGDSRDEQLVNNNGSGTTVSYTYNFRGDIYKLWGQECIDNSSSKQICASGSGVIFYGGP